MGYLNSDTITVDAILTRAGRKKLANGQALNPTKFIVTDTGVDYRLWNTDHPSGSAYYGEAITSIPQLEAVPKGEYLMRDRLITLNQNTEALPILNMGSLDTRIGLDWTNEPKTPKTVTVSTEGWELESYKVIIFDSNVITAPGPQDISGMVSSVVYAMDASTATVHDVGGAQGGGRITFTPIHDPAVEKRTTVHVFGVETGAQITFPAIVPADEGVRTRKTSSPIGG